MKPTLNEIVDDYKTYCCETEATRVGKHDYKCSKCNNDVTFDFYIYVNCLID